MAQKDWGKRDKLFLKLIKNNTFIVDLNSGEIWNSKKQRYLKNKRKRYGIVSTSVNKKSYWIYAHRLVYLAYRGKIPRGYSVNHINGDKKDNRASNLEAVPHSLNMSHSYETGLRKSLKFNNKISDKEVLKYRKLFRKKEITVEELKNIWDIPKDKVYAVIKGKYYSHLPVYNRSIKSKINHTDIKNMLRLKSKGRSWPYIIEKLKLEITAETARFRCIKYCDKKGLTVANLTRKGTM